LRGEVSESTPGPARPGEPPPAATLLAASAEVDGLAHAVVEVVE